MANLTRLLVVLAPLPAPDLFVVDRYLAAATAGGIAATLVVNKSDLGIDAELRAELEVYAAAGYGVRTVRAATGAEVAALPALLGAGSVAALVGQSASASPRWCSASCHRRRSRSVSWCARRKDATRRPPRACSSCPAARH